MPIPGPRTQAGPDPGYRNPDMALSNKHNLWLRPGPIMSPGRSPGLMFTTLRGCVLGAGQIRRLWRQSVNLVPAQAAFSWSENAPTPDRPIVSPGPLDITRALRYRTLSLYMGAGIDNSRYEGLHSSRYKRHFAKAVTINQGQVRDRPTVRNRMTSFGSRVPTLNQPSKAAEATNE